MVGIYLGAYKALHEKYNIKYQDIKQEPNVEVRNGKKYYLSSQNLPKTKRQGTQEVHEVIERFLE